MTDQTPISDVPTESHQQPDGAAPDAAAPDAAAPDAAAPHVPVEPEHPGTNVPPKKGLPGWALGLIIGGGVLLIAIIVGAIVVASLIANAVKQELNSAPGVSEPMAPLPASAEPSTIPTDPTNATGTLRLDSSAQFDYPPLWGAPYLSGWEITVLDQEGINRFENKSLGCTFSTSQNVQNVDKTSTSDAPTTIDLVDTLKGQIVGSAPGAVVKPTDPIKLSLGAAGSSSTIEFATLRLDYSLQSVDYASVLFARSMPQSGSYMYTFLECPLASLDGADSPLQALTDGLAIVSGP